MIRPTVQVFACLVLGSIWFGNLPAFSQEPDNKEKTSAVTQPGQTTTGQTSKPGSDKVEKAEGQDQSSTKDEDKEKETSTTLPHSFKGLTGRFLEDQKQIWTSPAQLRWQDVNWLVPLSGITAGLIVTDADMARHVSHNPTTVSHYNTVSNAGVAALLGGAGAMYLFSFPKHNPHWRETGFLAGEAVINSIVVTEAMKYSLGRQRPMEGDGTGQFFRGGVSFPSEHATAAWAAATIVAHEYPGPLTKIIVYSLASLVDYSRYRARQHFPSDVFVGSVVGNLVAEGIYNQHHDLELGGSSWDSFHKYLRRTRATSSANMGSPYVPLDSWVYPAMDRLIGQGFIRTAIVDMRPWTRFECARLVSEAGERLGDADANSSQAARIYDSLAQEFNEEVKLLGGGENTRVRMESAYSRFTGISGEPLSQPYHYDFGQTVINDFGRPYEEGFNDVTGFSAWATESYFALYARGEFQHAPGAPPVSAAAGQVISQTQGIPPPPGTSVPSTNQFELLDAYASMTLENWQFSYGKQSLWWGPGAGGPMMFSDNAIPLNMFRVSRISPFQLPTVLKYFGPIRVEFFVGQLSGHNFLFKSGAGLSGSWTSVVSPQPMISGERFSFKPTPNVEFGFSATDLFAGQGVPFTWHTYAKGIFRFGSGGNPGTPSDPGDGRSGFDLSYRLPFVRDWLTFYADGFTDDQFTPVAYWDRSAWTAGLYLSHVPKIPKLDLRMEGVYTDLPIGGAVSHGFFYWNDRYVMGYTNQGDLMGSWIGRQGQGAQAWSNYWLTPKNRIQVNFRHEKVSKQFVQFGGSLTDVGIQGDYSIRKTLDLSVSVQYERWLFPVIQPGPSTNVTTSIMLKYEPGKSLFPGSHWQLPATTGATDAAEGRP